jgi:hypothetical protein
MLRSHAVLSWSTVTMWSITRRAVGVVTVDPVAAAKEGVERVARLLIELDATQQFEAQNVVHSRSVYYSEQTVALAGLCFRECDSFHLVCSANVWELALTDAGGQRLGTLPIHWFATRTVRHADVWSSPFHAASLAS